MRLSDDHLHRRGAVDDQVLNRTLASDLPELESFGLIEDILDMLGIYG